MFLVLSNKRELDGFQNNHSDENEAHFPANVSDFS